MYPGRIIADKYRVLRVLGRGGMGVVCEAVHLDTEERVALKFLREDIESDMQPNERFSREGRLAARIDSPHACKFLGVDEWELGPFIIMELLEGRPLSAVLLPGEPLPWQQAVRIAYEACLALADAHRLGIVHRDIKPGNVFLAWTAQQRVTTKVLDFGVAKVPTSLLTLSNSPSLTDAALLLGTPAYVAPEQLTNSKLVDARADIWALGVLLYEMLSGRLPFISPFVPKLLVMIAKEEAPAISSLAPAIPPGLAQLVHRCLFKDPFLRFNDASALTTALLPFLIDSDKLLVPLLKAASLRPLRLSSFPPRPPGSDQDADNVAATAGRLRPDSLGPHTTSHRTALPRHASVPRLAVAAGIGVAALAGLAAGFQFVVPQSHDVPQPEKRAALSPIPDRLRRTTIEAGPHEANVTLSLDGKPLPTNPYVLSHDGSDTREHVLRAAADGFETQERIFHLNATPHIALALAPTVPANRPKKTAAKVAPKPTSLSSTTPPSTIAAAEGARRLDEANPY